MKNIWMIIAYNGTNFYGMAKQNNERTVQKVLEDSIQELINQKVDLIYSGRTDRWVHAKKQYAMIRITKDLKIEIENIQKVINRKLSDIKINYIWFESDSTKHPRYSVKEKTYEYIIDNNEVPNPIMNNHRYHIKNKIDLKIMNKYSKFLIGEMNFASFTGKTEYKNYIRTVNSINIFNKNNIIKIIISGPGFMRYMIRNIVGSLIDISIGKTTEEEFMMLINNPKRGLNHHKAEAKGLYLKEVKY